MAYGFKTGGRVGGTPNKERKGLAELLKDRFPDYHPVLSLADIANDMQNDLSIRFQAHKEIAKYICPQLKSIQGMEQTDNVIHVTIDYEDNEINYLNNEKK